MLPLASLGTFINFAATLFWLTIVAEGIAGNHFFKEQYHDLHHNMNDADLEKTFGVDNRGKVPEYEVIALYQSDEYGNKVENLLQGKTRARRATYEQNALYYNIQAFGRSMLLNVTRMKPLVSSNALIQTVHNDGTSTYKDIPHGLHYTGHVISDPDSLVALRENKGLTGMISTLEDKFYIQPLPSHLIKSNILKDSHPHVIYRRSNEEEVSSDFHSSDDIVRSLNQAKPGRRWRQKRQAPHKFLEVALVADNFAISAYGKEKMVDHLLTVAHIVTQLFQDKSIGPVKITPVILRVVLKNDGFGYKSSSTKGERIRAFEKWVAEEFPDSDKDPEHPDAAVLITRRTTGGIASLGSTCAKKFGAALANDVGLGTAIIVAHELAHTMGVAHDSSPCANHKNIMASTIPSGPGSLTWSACSRKKIQEFLRCDGFQLTTTEWPQEKLKTTLMQNLVVTNKEHYALTHTYPYSYRSDCLNDFPPISSVTYEPKRLYGKLTGQIINRDEQCKAIHGPSFYACPQRLNDCGALGCTRDGYTCSFTTASPADGTRCGYRHWCINGECVDDGSPVIHGHWSSWSAFSQCTRPCGGGVQSKTRTCTNPTPKNGGRNCVGPNKGHWRICNPQPCPAGSKTYRQIQCEAIDPNYHAYYVTSAWCLLACKKGDTVAPQGKNVKDGTRCYSNPSKKDVCIQGKCMVVGCDNGIESGVKRDRCGFCGGDSSKCKFVEKFWNDRCPGFGLDSACNIFEVPVGASSVYVEQDTPDHNLLEVKNKEGRRLIHVPSWEWSRTVFAAGTTIHYYHEVDVDINTIRIPGPTTEKLTVVFVPSGYPKTGVKYKMYDPNLPSEIGVRQVQWKVTNWGQCSRKCAQGKQERTVECSRTDDGSYLGDDSCLKKSNKPAAERSCNNHPCHPEWYKSEWSACSKSCGKGIQKRRIHCRRLISPIKHEILSDSSCGGVKPTGETQRSCNEINCPAKWRASAWSKCSSTCRGGVKKRSLTCKRLNYEGKLVSAPEILCYHAPKLQSTQQCNAEVPCPTSSPLVRYRGLGCFNDGQPHAIPHLVKSFRDHIDWKNMQKTVKECADYVYKHYPKSSVFGLQFYGECWSGSDAVHTYNRYGRSSNCWQNVGKEHTVYVYTFD